MTTPSRADEHGAEAPAAGPSRAEGDAPTRRGGASGEAGTGVPQAPLDELIDGPSGEGATASRAAVRAARSAEPRRPREPEVWKPRRQVAGVALAFAMFGLSMSWFMPWAAPASLVGVVLGSIAIARPWDDRAAGGWALGLGIAGSLGAAFWGVWIWQAIAAAQM